MISTRGRYALRVLLDLAENQNEGYIAMKTVAHRQELSLKYIERIMPVLSKNHYVEGADPFMEQLNKQGLPWHEVFDGDLEL